MKTITASELRRNCLRILGDVSATRESVVITRNGRPIVKLVPMDNAAKDFLGCLAGVIEVVGDIESPVEPPKAWEGPPVIRLAPQSRLQPCLLSPAFVDYYVKDSGGSGVRRLPQSPS